MSLEKKGKTLWRRGGVYGMPLGAHQVPKLTFLAKQTWWFSLPSKDLHQARVFWHCRNNQLGEVDTGQRINTATVKDACFS